ncbi:uncharacterized protein LOC117291764 [Asterias rubens]|uniref:uncharacterized protein LOC117291764 n=1 Tax=Asterias rubens TaxID=7604 RepID=UPI0014556652|nr:uncharacterized protein LOC117291764 [Asterias rubens]XP_033629553.1 uncharacterized protein LOC117291764 [Asterias rubens]XP_033629555.1 uncharacterized protein LOC117291764 [Asterias rubens]XP_033629556.1 uncharacterized protein LOC117291764 [Asterias rubens]
MGNAKYLPIILTLVSTLLEITATLVTIHSPGGHVGEEFNVHCIVRNHDGLAEFFRYKEDGTMGFIPNGNATKYGVFRCDKTEGGVSGEDSVLTVIKATVSDSGKYGCVPRDVDGGFKWDDKALINITVRSACSGADDKRPSSLTTDTNQDAGYDKNKQLRTDGIVEQSSQSPVAVILLSVGFAVSTCVAVVLFVMLYRERRHRANRAI